MTKKSVYPIGTFSGWRNEFIQALPNLEFDHPKDHNQSAIAKLDTDDMNSAMTCDVGLVYLSGNKRAGTMSYCELGGARAMGKCIIAVDENEKKDSLIEQIASHYYTDKKRAIEFLKEDVFNSHHNSIEINDKTKTTTPSKSILFTGNIDSMCDLIEEVSKTKKTYTRPPVDELEDFSRKFDTVVVNFDGGKNHNKYGLYHMGIAYATGVPVIELEGNIMPYAPLLGLARRVFTGEKRFEIANEYLKRLESQALMDEIQILYALKKKFKK